MTQIEVVYEKNQPLLPLHRNIHHDDNHKLNANYEWITATMNLDQTNHNMEGGAQPKKKKPQLNGVEERKKERTKKK